MTETPLIDMFYARVEARAMLVAAGEMSLRDAVDDLQDIAHAYGLIRDLGQDAVQLILMDAFAGVPR